ncbi:hypothetical protein ElP_68320 [Tautonia plasticadhaerens]|uniref:Uncharacterized protein n=1 Tax=Tautonia plasticadhaerens TaxID=2527974 RepID=A0A518HDH4_9BACT|nr:hypothetical protein ElP_68320 [Tautonia plasticadhaerens]
MIMNNDEWAHGRSQALYRREWGRAGQMRLERAADVA